MVNGLPLKNARIGRIGTGGQQTSSIQQLLDVPLHFVEASDRILHVAFFDFTRSSSGFGAQFRKEPWRGGIGDEWFVEKLQVGEPSAARILFHRKRGDDEEAVVVNDLKVVCWHLACRRVSKAV